jgi:6-phosphogluconolactonase
VSHAPDSVRVGVEVLDDDRAAAARGAAEIARASRTAVGDRGSCAIAVSGGRTPWSMFAALAGEDVPWDAVGVWQVDERIAPRGHEDRGLTHLLASLPEAARSRVHPMPVDDVDPSDDAALTSAAVAYAADLPAAFDLIHLGLGADGHTASLVPGDAALAVRDRHVTITAGYRGRRRMTLTFPVMDQAERIVWLVTGPDKAEAVRLLVARDPTIPASMVATPNQFLILDRKAASRLERG